jgi:hypothetical protein
MEDIAMKQKLADLVRGFEKERATDWTGLWEVAADVRRDCGISDNQKVKEHSLEAVRMLMDRGFRVGQFERYGDGKLILWPDQDPEAVVARIDREWDSAKGDPNINDICWFE